MAPIGRLITAFAVSPAASTLAMVAILGVIGRAIPSAGYVFTVATLTYGTAIVLGIPLFLLSRSWQLHSRAFYGVAGLVVAVPLIVLAAMVTEGVELPLIAGLSAAIGGVVFHEIMDRGASGT